MLDTERLTSLLPNKMRSQVDSYFETLSVFMEIRDPKVLRALAPSGVRGMLLHRGKQGAPTKIPVNYEAHFDWRYPADSSEMAQLYRRAKQGQWDGDSLPWEIDVDPENPARPLVPDDFLDTDVLAEILGTSFTEKEKASFRFSVACWLLSQFLHGEQGALFAACQVTEAVQFFDGKLYGATQVMDEGRHIEVFNRYLDQKLGRLYQINDNLFVIIDSLMVDSRWDMKFLGMQIMVEGLALGAFGVIYQVTREPLLRALLKMVIQDEARHVHFGVLALRDHFNEALTERERREREDWAFEVALLMRNRFMVYEVYEEWFEGLMTREQWRRFIMASQGMRMFRKVSLSRLVPNLRAIGLMSERILPYYEKVGLLEYFDGAAADQLTAEQMLGELG